MGKNKVIRSLGNIIGNLVIHKILLKYTNEPLSTNHLIAEIGTYRGDALEIARRFHWNAHDKGRIKQEAFHNFNKRIKKYSDVRFPMREVMKVLDETMAEVGL